MTIATAPLSLCIVQCVGQKRAEPAAARDLYVSDWFVKARAYVAAQAAPWLILSAEHGLVDPDSVLEPYDVTLNTMAAGQRARFAARVAAQVAERDLCGVRVQILAGRRYREAVEAALSPRFDAIEVPMAGLGIGQQKAWLANAVRAAAGAPTLASPA